MSDLLQKELLQKIDHVGIVVEDLDAAVQTYRLLGFRETARLPIPDQHIIAAFMQSGDSSIELIASTDPTSGTARFLHNRGEGVHHICYVVDDLPGTLAALQQQGLRLIDQKPRQGAHGEIAFLHPKAAHGVLIELLARHA
ncbi:MAG: methylmalonyl-CoA epimerase [Litorilinea sp.]